jgi:tetratricopeptide (TPR) repeat protein
MAEAPEPTQHPKPTETAIQAGTPSPGASVQDKLSVAEPEVIRLPPPPTGTAPEKQASARFVERLRGADYVLAFLVLVLSFFLGSFAAANSDVWLHLATGRAIAQGDYDFGVDPFAYTTEATKDRQAVSWINHSWLYDLVFYWLYNLVGGTGLVILKALVVIGLALVLLRIRRRDQPLYLPVICVALGIVAMSPRVVLQPTVIAFFFLGLTLYLLMREEIKTGGSAAVGERPLTPTPLPPGERGRGEGRHLWLLPVLFVFWVNLNEWFLLGPITVGLFLLGRWLQGRWGNPAPGNNRTLAAVLGVGLVACLLNPHHINAFVLPPELAYLVVSATDWLGQTLGISVSLPSGMVSGGRTLQALHRSETIHSLLSPLAGANWTNPNLALNVAGMAYVPLLIVSVGSFGLILIGGQKEARLGWGGLAVFLLFTVLSLVQSRLVPFFAVVAAPLAALNLQDYFRASSGAIPYRDRGARGWAVAGRFAAGLAAVVLLFLAWPGWLHARFGDFTSSRRVAWRMEPDPAHLDTAQELRALKQQGLIDRGFHFSADVAHYLAWFAPEVKGFFDSRYALFSHVADRFARVRLGLRAETLAIATQKPLPPRAAYDWQRALREHGIDHLVLTNYHREEAVRVVVMRFWTESRDWAQVHGNGRNLAFAWKPAHPERSFPEWRTVLHRQAFGRDLSADQQAPAEAPEPPTGRVPFIKNYALGAASDPLAGDEAMERIRYYQRQAESWHRPYIRNWLAALWAGPAGSASVVPGTASASYTLWAKVNLPDNLFLQLAAPPDRLFLVARDFGPPSAPLLAVRAARRAVAEAPEDPRSYLMLAETYKVLWRQEDHWAGPSGSASTLFRPTLRQLQILSALRHYLALQPQDPDVNWAVSKLYLEMNYLDAALEHLQTAYKNLRSVRPDAKNELAMQAYKEREKNWPEFIKNLEAELKKRRNDLDLRASHHPDFAKFLFALVLPYKTIDAKNKETVEPNMGLAKKALEILQNAKIADMKPHEHQQSVLWQVRLLMHLGQLKQVQEGLPDLKEVLGLAYFEYGVLVNGALGNYPGADAALQGLEKALKPGKAEDKLLEGIRALAHSLAVGPLAVPRPEGLLEAEFRLTDARQKYVQYLRARIQLAELRMLRGILALEQGDTASAALLLREARDFLGPLHFADRPVLLRYLELVTQ